LIRVLPFVRVVAAKIWLVVLSVTEPVGVGVPLTVTVTDNACPVVMLSRDGVTVTAGVALTTDTGADVPIPLLN
jgi:hypothetical protein